MWKVVHRKFTHFRILHFAIQMSTPWQRLHTKTKKCPFSMLLYPVKRDKHQRTSTCALVYCHNRKQSLITIFFNESCSAIMASALRSLRYTGAAMLRKPTVNVASSCVVHNSRGMRTMNFGGTDELVVERADYPADKIKSIFKDDHFAVVGYGVQVWSAALPCTTTGIYFNLLFTEYFAKSCCTKDTYYWEAEYSHSFTMKVWAWTHAEK